MSYKETSETWNKIADIYNNKFMDLRIYDETYDFFCEQLTDKKSILEIGCGPGNISKYILSKRPDLQLLGIDIAPAMIELATKNNPSATFQVMDCRLIDTIETTFDAIICGFCLPYLLPNDAEKFIKNCSQLLNAEGVFYLSFVEGTEQESGFKTSSTGDRVYFQYFELSEIESQLAKNNFEKIAEFKVDFFRSETVSEIHTVIVAKLKK